MIIRKLPVALCFLWIIRLCTCSNINGNNLIGKCVNTTIDQLNYNNNNDYGYNKYMIINSNKLNCIQINEIFNDYVTFAFNYYSTTADPGLKILLFDSTNNEIIDEISIKISKAHNWDSFTGFFTKRGTNTSVQIEINANNNASIVFRNIHFYTGNHPLNHTVSNTDLNNFDDKDVLDQRSIANHSTEESLIYESTSLLPNKIQNQEWTTPPIPPSAGDFTTPAIPPTDDGLAPDWTTPTIPPTADGLPPDWTTPTLPPTDDGIAPDWTTPTIPPTDDGLQPGPDWTTPTIPPTDDGLQPGPDWTTPIIPPTDDGLQPGPDWTTPQIPPTDDGLQPGPDWTTPIIPPTDDGLQPGPDWTTPSIPPTDDGLQPGPDFTTPTIPPTDDGFQPGPDWTTPAIPPTDDGLIWIPPEWPPQTELPVTFINPYEEWKIIGLVFIVLSAGAIIVAIVLIFTIPAVVVPAAGATVAIPRVPPKL